MVGPGTWTSRRRVEAGLRRESVDRVPIYMWFHPGTAARLGRLLEIGPERVAEAMGNDVVQTWVSNNYPMEGVVHEKDGDEHTDRWGVTWQKQGHFNQILRSPLAEATAEEVLDYRFPMEHLEEFMEPMARLIKSSSPDVFLGCDVSPCVFEMYWRLRGMEQTFLDMALRPELAETMFSRCGDLAVQLSAEACRRFRLDWLWTGDDVSGQQSLMMSPEQWRRMIRPHLARIVEVGRAAGLPVAYHCCGNLRPIIGDLIEIGITVLNPIQNTCSEMDPGELKREFGRDLAFMGGIDTQDLLPNGTAEEVRRATAELIEVMMADGGGYILAASHTVPPETPDENIFAMFEAAGVTREEIGDRAAGIRKKAGRMV